MGAADTTTSTLADEMQTYYDKLFLTVVGNLVVKDQFGQKRTLPRNAGKTIRLIKYATLSPATTALTESTNPAGKQLSDSNIECTVYEYGDYTQISSLVSLTAIDPDISGKTEIFGIQAAETTERLICSEVDDGGTAQIAGAKSALSDLATSDVITTTEIRKAVRTLKVNKAMRMADGYFVAVCNPYTAYDICGDSNFINASLYAGSTQLYKGELGKWMGVRMVEATETLRVDDNATENYSSGANHCTSVIGREAYGIVPLETARMVLHKGKDDTANALEMYYTYGWKMTFGVKVLNSDFIINIKSQTA